MNHTVTLSFEFWAAEYLRHLRLEKGRAAHTIRGYGDNLRYFEAFLRQQFGDDVSVEHLIFPVCRQYLASMTERGLQPKTVKKALAAVRGLVRYLADEQVIRDDWSFKLQTPKVVERRADPLTPEEARRLVTAIPRYTLAGQRDRVLFRLFLDTGLRVSEMLNLTVADCRLDLPAVIVRHGKGDKDRVVPLTAQRAQMLQEYLETVRPALARRDSPPAVWLSLAGRPLAATSCRDRLRYYARLAGLEGRRIYPHKLRATFATRLDRAGTNVTVIQELMGHADIKTTSHYVGVAGKEMRAAVEAMESLGE